MALTVSVKEARENLPIFHARREILQAVHNDKTVIFLGETANGKSTQIPQYLLEGGFARNRCIAITQPRQIAAISIAKRVAEEIRTELGGKVGYSVRFENVTSSATKIKYLTDGMLLRETISDPLLSEYSVVILDEVHERTLNSDILFGIVKLAQKLREDAKQLPLKVIIMSASTLGYKHLAKYFDDASVYFIRGREYSIKIMNASKEQEDYINAALVTVFQIHQNEEEGDILVFCTGQEEIDSMVSQVHKTSAFLPAGNLKIIACGLHAALPIDVQSDVFKLAPSGCRKVIFSTNIAETSVTIPGIKYVVDTGMVKAKTYNSACGFDVLSIQRISKAQADQRSGRVVREFNGVCYRLYTTEQQEKFKDFVPEILRCCLANAFLQMIAIGIKNIHKFDFIDKPSDENIHAAIKQLKLLDAVIERDGNLELTECGKKMVMFPLDPRFSKMIISSKNYKCTDEILTIISLLSVESIFYTALSQRERFNAVRQKFESVDGDHIMLLNVYRAFKNNKGNMTWCHENFINARNIKKAASIRKQLAQVCEQVGIKPCSSYDSERISQCLATGLFMNTAYLHKNKTFKTIEGNQKVRIHPASCLFKSQPFCCIYTELVQTSKIYMRNITRISEESLLEVAPAYFKDKHLSQFQLIPERGQNEYFR